MNNSSSSRGRGSSGSSYSVIGGDRSSGHSSYGPRRNSGGYPPRRSGGGYRGNNGGGRRGGFGRRGRPQIDVMKFINKPVEKAAKKVEFKVEHTFEDFKFSDALMANIKRKGFTAPTPIQDQSIMHVAEGKDLLGLANTGTGKTAAFLLPLLDKIVTNPNLKTLVIVPTRELAEQINRELVDFARGLRVFSVMCIGGARIDSQIYGLRRPWNFVIGTPGRLKDLTNRKALNPGDFNVIVLDEVDRMLDMGFIPDIKFLIDKFPQERQSLFFSATMNNQIETIAKQFLKEYVKVSVVVGETAANVHQDVIRVVDTSEKKDKLEELLNSEEYKKVLIFVRTKRGVDNLDSYLYRKGFKVSAIHGDKRQNHRSRAIDNFRLGRSSILIATDIAARGLDIPNVTHVINFDVPENYEDYIHRIGRTGRADKMGSAITFIGA